MGLSSQSVGQWTLLVKSSYQGTIERRCNSVNRSASAVQQAVNGARIAAQ